MFYTSTNHITTIWTNQIVRSEPILSNRNKELFPIQVSAKKYKKYAATIMLKIRKVHILARHLFNMTDPHAGIFFKGKHGGIEWLWTIIAETVDLYIIDTKEFTKRGEVWTSYNTQRKAILSMPQSSPVGLDIGSNRITVTGVLIVHD